MYEGGKIPIYCKVISTEKGQEPPKRPLPHSDPKTVKEVYENAEWVFMLHRPFKRGELACTLKGAIDMIVSEGAKGPFAFVLHPVLHIHFHLLAIEMDAYDEICDYEYTFPFNHTHPELLGLPPLCGYIRSANGIVCAILKGD